jgi:SAM-dependent methyltransferase
MTATIEEVKKFWNDRPCNVRHSNKEIGTKEYFDEVERKKFKAEPHILNFTNFSKWQGKKVLEIGCGLATVGINFAAVGADYTGVELSESSLEIAQRRFDLYDQPGRFYSGNAEQLSSFVPVKTYDLIYSFGVIHHSPHPEKIISEIKKYMNENSVLKIMLYAKDSWKNYMIESGLDQPEAQYGCPIAKTYTKQDVVELLEGYEVLSIEQDHIFPYQIEPYKKGEYIKQPWFESMPDKVFRILEKNLGWHLLITAKLK